ncbi:unnamed protein product, partial [Dibothriocephalus latus]
MSSGKPDDAWSDLEVEITQNMTTAAIATNTVSEDVPRGATFTIIAHERGELPFSAYDRSIHTMIPPATLTSIYFSKSVTRRINTARNPCHEGPDASWMSSTRVIQDDDDYDNITMVTATSSTPTGGGLFLDFLDKRRLGLKKQHAWPTANLPYLQVEQHSPSTESVGASVLKDAFDVGSEKISCHSSSSGSSGVSGGAGSDDGGGGCASVVDRPLTVRLFNTEVLYSRESCGWALCCYKVARNCNCTCSMDWLLSTGT